MKVLAAMSGGVDSAVAAALAVDAGHDVTGVHLALSESPAALRSGSRIVRLIGIRAVEILLEHEPAVTRDEQRVNVGSGGGFAFRERWNEP